MKFPVIHVAFLPAAGMAVFPFILVKKKTYKQHQELINHEKIHLVQQLEMFIALFYAVYLLNYLLNLLRYRDHNQAYLNIAFEREAYEMEKRSDYLEKRRFWAWLPYL